MDFKKLEIQYRDELLNNVIPFWLENSQDKENDNQVAIGDLKGVQIVLVKVDGKLVKTAKVLN